MQTIVLFIFNIIIGSLSLSDETISSSSLSSPQLVRDDVTAMRPTQSIIISNNINMVSFDEPPTRPPSFLKIRDQSISDIERNLTPGSVGVPRAAKPPSRRIDTKPIEVDDEFNISSKCWISRYHRGCSCTRFQDNFSINCSNAGLSAVPKKWTDIGDFITTLNLEKNQIKEINEGDFYGVKIRRLLLANNSLSELKLLTFWGLTTSLETLDLSYNKLRVVPSESAKLLINLKTLILTGNEIEQLGAHDIGFWKKLEVLTLDNNPILTIHPSCISGTKSLSFLSLDNLKLTNKIQDISRIEIDNIKGLSLTRNGISNLPPRWAKNFTSLTLLNLGHNQIKELDHEDIFYGVQHTLKNLDLHRNRLNKVPILSLRKLTKLSSIDLSGNKITRIKKRSFNESKNLQHLDLSYNRINKISKKAFIGLDSIQKIDLRNNRLITLDDRVFGWSFPALKINHGKQVFLSGNPWLCNCVLNWLWRNIQVGRTNHSKKDRMRKRRAESYYDGVINKESDRSISPVTIFSDDPICERPTYLKGTLLSQLTEDDLTCTHDYYYYEDDEITTQSIISITVDAEDPDSKID